MSDDRYLDIDGLTGEMIRRIPITTSSGVGDAFRLARTRYDGKFDPSLIPSTGGQAADIGTFVVGVNAIPAFTVVVLIDDLLEKASAVSIGHAGYVIGVTIESGAPNMFCNVQLGGLVAFPTAVFGDYRGQVFLGSNGTVAPVPVPGSWFVQCMGKAVSDSELELQAHGLLVMLDAAILPSEGDIDYATETEAGIVILAEHGEITATEVVQSDDPRITGYHHTQSSPSASWVIPHMLNQYVNVMCTNAGGEQIVGAVTWNSRNQITIAFSQAVTGHAYII